MIKSFQPTYAPEVIATKTADGSAFAVFKTATGLRWLAFSSNGYEDKDKEIVSTKALGADVQRTAADGLYGPLRWWHIGDPDPANLEAPWGPGLDLGWCDFAAMSGPFLVESGTFVSDAVGEAIARKAKDLALSLGFFHPRSEPDADGVFHHIRRFERSLAPIGRVSNPLTALYVPGATMNEPQIAQLKALLGDAIPETELKGLLEKYTSSSTKAAETAGLRFKADDVTAKIAEMEAQIAALKASITPAQEETAQKADAPAAAAMEVETEEEEPDGDFAGDMSVSDFKAVVAEAVKAALGGMASEMKALNTRLNMAEKMGAMMEEMKGYMSGTAQKDDARSQQIVELETRIKTLSDQLAELLGDQPAAVVASQSDQTVTGVEAPEKFDVQTKAGKVAFAHPADQIGAWIEGIA